MVAKKSHFLILLANRTADSRNKKTVKVAISFWKNESWSDSHAG